MRQGINYLLLLRVLGILVMIEAVFMIVPLLVSVYLGEDDARAFIIATAITLGSGAFMTFVPRPRHHHMGKREGFLLTALTWVIFSLFGMIPFLLCSTPLRISNAFFEAMSGFTTTGASVIESIDHLSHGIHIWRALMQWIGGMGIILFTLAVIPMLNSSGGMQMFNAEVTGITHEKLRPRVSSTAKRLWLVYALLTLSLIFLYWIGPMHFFDAVCHAFSTMSTGGFSTRTESISAWNSLYVKIVTTLYMFVGGVNFALIFKASTGQFKAVWNNQIFRVYIKIILCVFFLFDAALILGGRVALNWESLTVDPLFQIVSMMSSTGFTINGFADWGIFILSVTIVLMFFGACAGSTSGGAKLDRAVFLVKNLKNEIYRSIFPNRILSVDNNGKTLSPEIVNKVLAFLALYVIVILLGGIALAAMDVPLIDGFFSAFSCVSNTGLESGLTGYGGSYDGLPQGAMWVLSMLMLTGRLEIFTVLVLLIPGFWRK